MEYREGVLISKGITSGHHEALRSGLTMLMPWQENLGAGTAIPRAMATLDLVAVMR